jgi:predicted TIM-barrel fold metal-dependent hydrolase
MRTGLLPPVLRPLHSDEYSPVPPHRALARATAAVARALPDVAHAVALDAPTYAHDRRATALALRAIDAAHGGGFWAIDAEATYDAVTAAAAFDAGYPLDTIPSRSGVDAETSREVSAGGAGTLRRSERSRGVVDVQTHLVDPALWRGPHADALGQFLRLVDPDRWRGSVDPHAIDGAAWAALVFGASETAVALLTSTPGPTGANVLENAQIAAVRDVTDRYVGSGRVLTHTIVHPNLGPAELDRMGEWSRTLRPSAWKVYTLAGPPTAASPTGGWFLDDAEVGAPFLERVREFGPRIVCAHKGLGGPVPGASVAAASPRDIGPAASAFPDVTFVVYHSGYERDPYGAEGAFDPIAPSGVDRLVASVRAHGIDTGGNVYAELGSTWFLLLRRPAEAAHVLGKLLMALGPERILWGTDSTWYGSPQPLIDAFRAFTIPERMQAEFGYPPLTDAVKARILGTNAADLYGIEVPTAVSVPAGLAPALLAAIDAART